MNNAALAQPLTTMDTANHAAIYAYYGWQTLAIRPNGKPPLIRVKFRHMGAISIPA